MMRKFHVIAGLPRSGSTLLCNVLNQNPAFHASSTSALPRFISALSEVASACEEIKSDLMARPDDTTTRLRTLLQAAVFSWYGEKEIVFDKARIWSKQALLVSDMFSSSKIIVTVRDVRAVLGSIEKQHLRDPALNALPGTLAERLNFLLSSQGLVGGTIPAVVDLKHRRLSNVFVVDYDTFSAKPDRVLSDLYEFIGEPAFSHDLEDVKNVATDADGMYLNKYPHVGSGKIVPSDPREWERYIPPDLAREAYNLFPKYNAFYGFLE